MAQRDQGRLPPGAAVPDRRHQGAVPAGERDGDDHLPGKRRRRGTEGSEYSVRAENAGGRPPGRLCLEGTAAGRGRFGLINDKPITALGVVQAELAAGNGKPVKVIVERAGARVPVTITPAKNSAGRYILGVLLQYKFTFPFDVTISLDKVGGPSAGMMFALGIIDTVTPGDLTGGKHIAGTGTITPDGAVGPIGGIAQKMQGARSGGATFFLAPAAN